MSEPYPYVENLAREIGAPFEPWHESETFKAAWVQILAGALMAGVTDRLTSDFRAKIERWMRRIQACSPADLKQCLAAIVQWIEDNEDMDDGWPTDPIMFGVYRLCLALQERTRWLAEAGLSVHSTVVRMVGPDTNEANRWLRDIYAQAAQASKVFGQPPKQVETPIMPALEAVAKAASQPFIFDESLPPIDGKPRYRTAKPREMLLFASYCGGENPNCSDGKPCSICLGMSNIYTIPAGTIITYTREMAPERNTEPEKGGSISGRASGSGEHIEEKPRGR